MNKVLLLAATMLVALLGLSGQAFAATGFERVGAFAETYPDGQPAHQKRIAVNHASGDVYVTDQVNDQIAVYHPNGTGADPLTTFGSGDLTDPFGIAIDQSDGDVYVSDVNGIVKYASDGAATPTFTKDGAFSVTGVTGALAFDASSSSLLIADTATNTVRRYTTAGTAGATSDGSAGTGSPGAFAGLQDLAVDSTGDVIVVDSTGNPATGAGASRVERFASNGDWKATIGPVATAATVAVRPSSDEVIVSGDQNKVYTSGGPTLHVFAADGTPGYVIDDVGAPVPYATVSGVASATGAGGQLFVATDNADYNGDYSFGYVSVQVFNGFVLPPAVVSDEAATPTETGAKLSAKVNPNRSTTTWTFEYGTSTSYGKQFPVTPASIPSGTDPVAVARKIGGLQPATIYHYRVVATNAAGIINGADHTFTTGAFEAPSGGVGRASGAYEQVSPVDKGHASVEAGRVVQSSPSGDAAAFSLVSTLPGSAAGVAHGTVVARRSATGWSSEPIDAPQQNLAGTLALPTLVLSEGLESAFQFGADPAVPGTVADGGNLYLRDRTGARRLVAATGRLTAGDLQQYLVNAGERPAPSAASLDLSHVAFGARDPLLPDAMAGAPNVYEFSGRELRLVNRLPDGSVTPGGAVLGSAAFPGRTPRRMSDDGRRVNFGTPTGGITYFGPSDLYQRIDGTRTVAVSAVHRAGEPATPIGASYAGASRDGTKVFFTGRGAMTDQTDVQSLRHLYRYDVESDQLTDLTPINDHALVAPSSVIVSNDGRTVAFVAQSGGGPLTPDAPAEADNVYVSRDGVLKYVGSMVYDELPRFGRLSPDGLTLAFTSTTALTGFDNRGVQCEAIANFNVGAGACQEVFVYDVASDHLVCASCDRSMAPQHSDTDAGYFFATAGGDYGARQVFDDGTVYFNSRARLVSADVNGVRDVYRWNAATGPVLVSAGRGSHDSTFAEVSADQSSVFFRTVDRLVGQDRDDDIDLYALRVGGGIAGQDRSPDAVAACDGDTCQGSPTGAVGAPVAGSVVFTGPGDGAAVVRRGRVTLSRKAVGAGSLTVAVKVPGRGTISVSGNGLRTARRSVAESSTVSVRLTLTAAARARLHRAHRLGLTVRVSYNPVGGAGSSASLALTLTGPKAKKPVARSVRPAGALSMSSTKGR